MPFIEAKTGTLAKIKVVGVGGGGQNSVSSMVDGGNIDGVEFIVMNTDLQALNSSSAEIRVQLGPERTHGLGSGSDPSLGLEAAQESIEDIKTHLQGAAMVFIASGMGGGTGTGAAPVVAQVSKELGALTIGVITKPFEFEGSRRMNQAEQGIRQLKDKVDALIVIPNQKILDVVEDDVSLIDAFKVADGVIGKAVEGISDLITTTGLVNVDFTDVKAIMRNAGSALMGIGEAKGEDRAERAAKAAINSPLLDVDIEGSTGILINIVGDSNLTMHEVNTASKIIAEAAHDGANIIWGANINPDMEGIKVTVIATGFDSDFKSIGLPDYQGMSDEEVITQIDSRFDQGQDNSGNDDEPDNPEQKKHKEPSTDYSMQQGDSGEPEEFDIERLRAEVEEMEEEKQEEDDNDNEDEKGGFWDKFIKDRK